MKLAALILWCSLLSLSAAAQWASVNPFSAFNKRHNVPDLYASGGMAFKVPTHKFKHQQITTTTVPLGDYTLELAETATMKNMQAHMHYRMYYKASYDFNTLARLYEQQNRLSEAKWFFLQSNLLAREQNNDQLTIDNLLQLSAIKAAIGNFVLAQQDLLEARDIASAKGHLTELLEVEKHLSAIQQNRFVALHTLRYDDKLKKAEPAD